MPPKPPGPPITPLGPLGWCVIAGLLAALIAAAISWPDVVAVCFGALLFAVLPGKLFPGDQDQPVATVHSANAPAPPRPPMTLLEWFILAGLLAALVAVVIERPVFVWNVLGLVSIASLVVGFFANRNAQRLTVERAGEDIGTFARGFDRRAEPFDPWVVRATWDALRLYTDCPLRPTDQLQDLGIDGLEMDYLFVEIAERSGRSLDDLRILEPVETIGDFVRFLSVQPRLQR